MALPNGDLITTPFDPQMAYPSDRRMQVDTLNSRDSMSMFIRWEGMEVYVLENSKKYILQGGRSNEYWMENGTGTGTGGTTFVGQFATDDLLPTSGRSAGDYAFVGTGEDFVQYNWDNISGQWIQANQGAVLRPNGVVQVGSATINDNSVDLDNQWIWTYDNVNYQKTTATNIPIPAATSGYFRLDWIVGNTSNEIERIAGTESDTTAIAPVVPVDKVPLVQVFVDENGIQYIEEQALSTFVRYDVGNQGLSSSQRLNARNNIQAVSKDTNDTISSPVWRFLDWEEREKMRWEKGSGSGNGSHISMYNSLGERIYRIYADTPQANLNNLNPRFFLKGVGTGTRSLVTWVDGSNSPVFGITDDGTSQFSKKAPIHPDAVDPNQSATLGQVQSLIEISEETAYTEMSADDFFIGYRVDGEGERIEQIFDKGPKDVIVTESGDFVFAPETAVARFIFTGEVTAIRGIETAEADREIKLVNRTGSDIPLRDKASGIPSGSGMDFGGSDYVWVNGSEITLKGNGTYWKLAPNNQIAFSDHLDSVNAVTIQDGPITIIDKIIDSVSKKRITLKEASKFLYGTAMDDSKLGVYYKKIKGKYFVNADFENNPTINIKDFGAIGDGIIDDTLAIQSAIDEAEKTHSDIFLPVGRYITSSTIRLYHGCKFFGADKKSSIIIPTMDDESDVIEFLNTAGNQAGVTLCDFAIYGSGNDSKTGYGIRIDSASVNNIHDIRVMYMGGGAIRFSNGYVNWISECYFGSNGRYEDGIYGDPDEDWGVVQYDYMPSGNGLHMSNCYLSNNRYLVGVRYIGSAGRFLMNHIESCKKGVVLGEANRPTRDNLVMGLYFENIYDYAFDVIEAENLTVDNIFLSPYNIVGVMRIHTLIGGFFRNINARGTKVYLTDSDGVRSNIKFENNTDLRFDDDSLLSGISIYNHDRKINENTYFQNILPDPPNDFSSWSLNNNITLEKDQVFFNGEEVYSINSSGSTDTMTHYVPGDIIGPLCFSAYVRIFSNQFSRIRIHGNRISDGVLESIKTTYCRVIYSSEEDPQWQKVYVSAILNHRNVRVSVNGLPKMGFAYPKIELGTLIPSTQLSQDAEESDDFSPNRYRLKSSGLNFDVNTTSGDGYFLYEPNIGDFEGSRPPISTYYTVNDIAIGSSSRVQVWGAFLLNRIFIRRYSSGSWSDFTEITTPDSTTAVRGKIELATQTEVNTGTDAERAVTPATLQGKLDALILSTTATLDFPTIAAGETEMLTATVTGAALLDPVLVSGPTDIYNSNNSAIDGWVSATNTVTVRVRNNGASSIDPGESQFKIKVFK